MNNEYLDTSSYMTRNGSHASLLADDAPVAQSWEIDQFFQPTFQDSFGDSSHYENLGQDSKQSLEFLADWVPEGQANHSYTHAANPNTSYPTDQSPETPVQQGSTNFCKTNVQKNFVRKLYDMLGDVAANAYIYWNQDGKSFVIENPEQFAKKVLKRYLKTENFQSFIRQLNMYDFHKINRAQRAQRAQRGVQAQATQYVFSHTKFRRDEPELLSEIRRKGTEQPLDAPPEYNSVFAASKFGLGMAPGAQALSTSQPDCQPIIFQAEIQRLNERLAALQAAYNKLYSEHASLKACFQAPLPMPMPQVQNAPPSSVISYQATHSGNAINQALDLNRGVDLSEQRHPASAPVPTEAPVLFQQTTGPTDRSNNNQTASTSCVSLNPTVLPIRRRPSNAQPPNMGTNSQPAPQQPQERNKARPGSWYENVGQWLGYLPGAGSHNESGHSAQAGTFTQDAPATYNMNHGKGKTVVGTRSQPVAVAPKRQVF